MLIFYQINSRSYAPTVTASISQPKSPISILPSRSNTTTSPISDNIAHSLRPLGVPFQAGADRPVSLFALGHHTHQTNENGPFPSFSFSKFPFSFSTFRCSSQPTETQQRTPINETYTRDWSPEFYLFLWFNNPKSFIGSPSERLIGIVGLPYPFSSTDYGKALRQRAIGFLFYLVVLYILSLALSDLDRSQARGIRRTRASPVLLLLLPVSRNPPQSSLNEAVIARLNCIQTRWFSSLIAVSGTQIGVFSSTETVLEIVHSWYISRRPTPTLPEVKLALGRVSLSCGLLTVHPASCDLLPATGHVFSSSVPGCLSVKGIGVSSASFCSLITGLLPVLTRASHLLLRLQQTTRGPVSRCCCLL